MNKLKLFTLYGIFFVILTGTISHFVYEWSGNNPFLALFFPVSESTWEHMKLSFFPMLLYSFYMNYKLKNDYPCVTSALLFGVLSSAFFIPVIFYTYTGILGYHTLSLDIATFIISVLLAFLFVFYFSSNGKLKPYTAILKILIAIMTVCFFLFTYYPMNLGIFS